MSQYGNKNNPSRKRPGNHQQDGQQAYKNRGKDKNSQQPAAEELFGYAMSDLEEEDDSVDMKIGDISESSEDFKTEDPKLTATFRDYYLEQMTSAFGNEIDSLRQVRYNDSVRSM
jgi:hypothetical protein